TALHATVVGVVNDYVYGNIYGKPDPVIFFATAPRFENVMYVRMKPMGQREQAISKIEAVMKKDNPAYPFEYRFVDNQMNDMFSDEILVRKLSSVFATLAIFISCLGLFGLAAFTAERRTKEIGIRKVLGASVASISGLVSKDFIKLVLIASLIAFPIVWWIMHDWLKNFEYRVEISWWIFLAAAVLATLIALITVSSQAIRAAVANPVRSLRTE
ncbi:MAG TPA: FtsX-like permease family protein, partial [Puia sp.]|nr:FtsX-like permease family protein [Puia sp.]